MTTLIQNLTDFIQFQWLSFLIGFHLWDFLCFVESLWFGNKSPKPKPLGRRVGNARKIWAGGQGQQDSETKKPSQWTTGPTQTQPNPGNSSWSHEPMATRTHVSVSVGVRRGLALPALPPSVGRSLAGCGWLAGWLPHRSIIGAWILMIFIIVLCCNFMGIMGWRGRRRDGPGVRPVFEAQQGMPVHQSFVVSPISIGCASTQTERTRTDSRGVFFGSGSISRSRWLRDWTLWAVWCGAAFGGGCEQRWRRARRRAGVRGWSRTNCEKL